jgi:hypothetical protein
MMTRASVIMKNRRIGAIVPRSLPLRPRHVNPPENTRENRYYTSRRNSYFSY